MNAMTNEREAPGPIYVLINQHGVLMEDRSFSDANEAARMAEAYTDFEDRFHAVEVAPVVRESVAPSAEPAQPVEAVDDIVSEALLRKLGFAGLAELEGFPDYTKGNDFEETIRNGHLLADFYRWLGLPFEQLSGEKPFLTTALAHPRPTGDAVEAATRDLLFKLEISNVEWRNKDPELTGAFEKLAAMIKERAHA